MTRYRGLLLLLVGVLSAWGVNGMPGHSGEVKEELQETHQHRVSEEILGLIEVAVKVAQYTKMEEKQKALGWVQTRVDHIKGMLEEPPAPASEKTQVYYEDCASLRDEGFTHSGVYSIYPEYPESTEPLTVFCDQETDGGGWIVFQRRIDGLTSFEKFWDEYRQGFGEVDDEFWLGNDNLVLLTSPSAVGDRRSGGNVVLRVDIMDWEDNTAFAEYSDFSVQGPRYTLTAEGYQEKSTAGDALEYHNGMDFTTLDQDNDEADGGNCAEWMRGGWWFSYCLQADPNGPYLRPGGPYGALSPGADQGITWTTYTAHGYDGRQYSLKTTEMKMRREPAVAT